MPPDSDGLELRYAEFDAYDNLNAPFELRAAADERASPGTLVGYAVLWLNISSDLGGFVERFAQGAFDDVLGSDIACLVDHDMARIVGRTTAKTLRVAPDDRGLRYEVDLPATTTARDLAENVRLGNIRGSSFRFAVPPEGERVERLDGKLVRTVTRVSRLRDLGPTTFPAYPDTTAAMRSVEAFLAQQQDGEAELARLHATASLRRRRLALDLAAAS